GVGPLTSVTRWEYSARFDRAGSIAFAFDAADPVAASVPTSSIARCFALLDDVWREVGAGIVDRLGMTPLSDGRVTYGASGLDLLRELSYRGVGQLEVGKPNGVTHAAGLAAIAAYAPPLWTLTPAVAPGNNYIYAR